jgi:serine protease Do
MNPGNSGGPLFDRDAQVLAVVSFKVLGGGIEGIGFGVPVSAAERALGLHWD